MSLQQLQHVIRRWLWVLVALTVLAAGITYRISSQLPKVYESTAKLRLIAPPASSNALSYDQMLSIERLARTYAEELKSRQVLELAVQQAGLNLPYEAALDSLDVKPLRDTEILLVTTRAGDPEVAARFANQLSATFIQQVQTDQASQYSASKDLLNSQFEQFAADLADRRRQADALRAQPASTERDNELARLQVEIDQLQAGYQAARNSELVQALQAQSGPSIVVLDPATPLPVPVQPRVTQNVLFAALAALLVAGGLAFAVEYFDDRLLSAERVARFTGLLTLGMVGRYRRSPDASQLAEAFRLLYANLQFAALERPLKTLLITSCSAGDGKSTTATNLALVAARAGSKVLLVDADLRRPTLHAVFGLPNRIGLTSLLINDQLAAAGTLQPTRVPGLSLVLSGPMPPNPGELLASQRMRTRLAELRELADLVILDTSPVLPVSDPAVLAGWVDGTLLVVTAGRTRGQQAAHAVTTLKGAGAHLLGVVLNRVPRGRGAYEAYNKYTQAYDSEPVPSAG